jgi:ferrous iron transport protein A
MWEKSFPLSFLPPGEKAKVEDITGGLTLRQRLTELGIIRGKHVEVIRNDNFGPLIITIGDNGDCRLAIGRGMAQKIMVIKEGNKTNGRSGFGQDA